jgi:hypothetical protein
LLFDEQQMKSTKQDIYNKFLSAIVISINASGSLPGIHVATLDARMLTYDSFENTLPRECDAFRSIAIWVVLLE